MLKTTPRGNFNKRLSGITLSGSRLKLHSEHLMADRYRCYFLERDSTGRSLASVEADNPKDAIEKVIQRYPQIQYRRVEVWNRSDRVLVLERI